jgi:transketolase
MKEEFYLNEDKKIATRESFGKALAANTNESIVVLDADLSTSTKVNEFAEKYPNRFIENGIAESDMIGTAAGLATAGKIPVAASFASFATGRVYDQIRCSVAIPNLNVKIIGTHAGITVGEDGATHQMLEDISLMRTLPNMVVLSPSDDVQTEVLVNKMIEYQGPVYMRLSRKKTCGIYDISDEEVRSFDIGKAIQIGSGEDVCIFATGDTVEQAIIASSLLSNHDIKARVVDVYSIKPIDREMIIRNAKECKMLVSVEDHNIIGGLGSSICEVLCDENPKKLLRIGINDTFGMSGNSEELMKYYKIDADSIVERIIN